MELVFEDVSTFDAENPIVGSLLRETDLNKKQTDNDFIKSLPSQPGKEFEIQKRLDTLNGIKRYGKKNNNNNDNNSGNLFSPPPPGPGGDNDLFPPRQDKDQDYHHHQIILQIFMFLHRHLVLIEALD